MRSLLRTILFWALLAVAFLYFYSAGISESSGFKKLKIESKRSGNGFVVRMKPEGWEVWKVEKKVETAKVYPKQAQPVANPEEAKPDAAQTPAPVTPA